MRGPESQLGGDGGSVGGGMSDHYLTLSVRPPARPSQHFRHIPSLFYANHISEWPRQAAVRNLSVFYRAGPIQVFKFWISHMAEAGS